MNSLFRMKSGWRRITAARSLKYACVGLLCLLFSLPAAVQETRTTPVEDQWRQYNEAVIQSATYSHDNLRDLFPLNFDPPAMTTKVVTLTTFAYQLGTQTIPVYLWVTAVPEVKTKCGNFTDPDLALRLRQFLGLQPEAQVGNFVTMTVRAGDIFRPAANPITTTKALCFNPQGDMTCGELFPDWVSDDHRKWIGNKMLTAYLVSNNHNSAYSYPWTRLGYTYDWKPGADKYGASEYVIRPGAVVQVTDMKPFTEYCGRP